MHNKGLSLIEFLFSLSIFSVIISLALPFGMLFYEKNQLEIIATDLKFAIHYARTYALLNGVPLILTPLDNTKDWSYGILLLQDNPEHIYHPQDKIIYQWQWPNSLIIIQWKGFYSANYLRFSSELKSLATNGHFNLIGNFSLQKKIIINRLGRVNIL